MGNRNLVIKGVSWIASARVIVTILGLASTLILARLLTPEDFGLVAIAGAITVVIASITDLSLAQALVQHKDPKEYHYDTAWTLNNLRAILLSVLIAASADFTATAYGDPRLFDVIMFLAAATLLEGLQSPRMIIFQRNLIFWQEFALSVIEKAAGFVVGVTIAWYLENYWALVVGGTAARVARIVASYFFAPYRPRLGLKGYGELLSFSIWLTLSRTVQMANWRADPLILGTSVGPSALGLYSMSDNLAGMPIREGLGPIRQTLFPAFSRIKEDMPRLRAAYLRAQGLLCLLALPIGIGFAAIAEPAIGLLLGDTWLPAVTMIQALSILFALEACEGYQPLAMALGRTRAMFGRELRICAIRLPLLTAGMLWGVHVGGDFSIVMGAILGRSVASAINIIWNMTLIRSMAGVSLLSQIAIAARPILAAGIMFLVLNSMIKANTFEIASDVGVISLVMLIVTGAFIYMSALLCLWLIVGRPNSAEAEILRILAEIKTVLKRRRSG